MIYDTYKVNTSFVDIARELGVNVPSDFICPITLDVMIHPLMTRNGINYDRNAIVKWLSNGSRECPLTRQTLTPIDLIPNNALEKKISIWIWENCLPELDENNINDIIPYAFIPSNGQNKFEKIFYNVLQRNSRQLNSLPNRSNNRIRSLLQRN